MQNIYLHLESISKIDGVGVIKRNGENLLPNKIPMILNEIQNLKIMPGFYEITFMENYTKSGKFMTVFLSDDLVKTGSEIFTTNDNKYYLRTYLPITFEYGSYIGIGRII